MRGNPAILSALGSAVLMFAFAGHSAHAQIITDKAKCLSHLKIIEEMNEEEEIGPKLEPIVADLVKVLAGYCESGKFDNADEVANAIRGLLATEQAGG